MSRADTDTAGEATVAIGHIERRAAEVRTEEVSRAIQRLEGDGDLTDEQRAAVEALGERLVEALLAEPRTRLRESDGRDDDTAATAIELFNRGSGR